jgi:hypothetical protein
LPMVGWRIYVTWRLFDDWGWTSLAPDPDGFMLPFAGFMELFRLVISGAHPSSEARAALAYPILLSLGLFVAAVAWIRLRHVFAAAAIAYGAMAVSLNYEKVWTHVPSGERATYELFLTLLVLAILTNREHPGIMRYVLLLFAALGIYTFMLSPEAALARSALLLIR